MIFFTPEKLLYVFYNPNLVGVKDFLRIYSKIKNINLILKIMIFSL